MAGINYLEYVELVDGSRGLTGMPVQFASGISKGVCGTIYRMWASSVDGEPMMQVAAYRDEPDEQGRMTNYLLSYPIQLRSIKNEV
jgi:hypothetical protein